MELTREQRRELKTIKSKVLFKESQIEQLQSKLDLSLEFEDHDKVAMFEASIEAAITMSKKEIELASKEYKVDYNTMVDLVFDTEYTLNRLKS